MRADGISTATWDGVILNNERPPFNDVRVRQALAATIDKEALVELALFGQGAPTHSPIPPSHPYFNKELGFKKPDIAKAKKLLAEAGHAERLRGDDAGAAGARAARPPRRRRARHGARRPASASMSSACRSPPTRRNVAGKAQMYVDGYFARPTIDTALYPFYHSTGSWNRQLWLYKNARVDELLDTARKTNDEGKRKAIFDEFQKVVDETVPSIIAYSALHVNGVRKEVEGFHSTPMQWLELKEVTLKR